MIYKDIEEKINNLTVPNHWTSDNPNKIAKDNAIEICKKIYEIHKLLPKTIAATIEEGVYINYDDPGIYNVVIETYNTGEKAVIVVDKEKKIIVHRKDL